MLPCLYYSNLNVEEPEPFSLDSKYLVKSWFLFQKRRVKNTKTKTYKIKFVLFMKSHAIKNTIILKKKKVTKSSTSVWNTFLLWYSYGSNTRSGLLNKKDFSSKNWQELPSSLQNSPKDIQIWSKNLFDLFNMINKNCNFLHGSFLIRKAISSCSVPQKSWYIKLPRGWLSKPVISFL